MNSCSFRHALKVFNVQKQGKNCKGKRDSRILGTLHESELDKTELKKKKAQAQPILVSSFED